MVNHHTAAVNDSTTTEEPGWNPSTHQLLIMVMLSIASFSVALESTVIVTSLQAIILDFSSDYVQGFWIGTSYLLASAVVMPFIAAVSDVFGRPICLTVSLALFTVGTLFCCLARDIAIMLIGRSVQGVGGGGILVLSLVIYADIVPLRYRPKWFAIVQAAWAIGNISGLLLGGGITQKTTWRWIFYIMFPFCGFCLVSISAVLTIKPREASTIEKLARVDWIGGSIFVLSATLFLIATSWGGTQHAWRSAPTLVPLVLGIFGLAATALWETLAAVEPFLKRGLFPSVSSVATYFCGFIQGIMMFGQLYYIPLYLVTIRNFSSLRTSFTLLSLALTVVPGSVIAGRVVTRMNNYQFAIWTGWILITVATGLTLHWDINTDTAFCVGTLVLLGCGHGCVLSSQNIATQAMCEVGKEAAAASMYAFLRQFGAAIGVGIGGNIFQNVMKRKLVGSGHPQAIAGHPQAYIEALRADQDASMQLEEVLQICVFGIRGVYSFYTGAAGLALGLSFLIRHQNLNKGVNSEHTL